ncbi:MAG: bifunctional diguanylate cyclase/phosphodiesterase [Burkholderiaceae bacterium]|nr:MAG: bifunctional diguanylate cyclase/phosphodiesterase [Burkholderiaceae bacterium]
MEDHKLYQREMLLEIAMSVGASLDLEDMLKACIPGILKRLLCTTAWVVEIDGARIAPVYGLPRNADASPVLDFLNQCEWDRAAVAECCHRWVHLWRLPDYGALVLVRNAPLPDTLRHEIGLIANKLAAAIHACRQYAHISKLKQELAESEQRWSFALEGGGDTVWDWNLETDRVLLSKGHDAMLGYRANEDGTDMPLWLSIVHDEDKSSFLETLRAFFREGAEKISVEYRVRTKSGAWKWLHTRGMVVRRDAAGRVAQMIGTHTDINARKKSEAEVHRLAFYDPLTNLANRRLLQGRLAAAIAAAAHSGLYGALFFIDLDDFKALNDTRGHDIGDRLLVAVAQRLRDAVREHDIVARQGGDEFVIVMEALGKTGSEAAAQATQLGDTVIAALTRPFNLNGFEYHGKISIGVDLFHGRESVELLYKHADLALYQAKHSARGKLRFFNPAMQDALDRRSALGNALHKVIERQELSLHYQPQISGAGQLTGVEALLRWHHPQRGLVPPDEFIPLAEDTGLIQPIGRWVLEMACAQIKQWECDPLTNPLTIAVNVSARQFHQPDFAEQVQRVLKVSGANPERLKLELTESMMSEDVQDTIAKMQAIKKLKVLFSLDDFGTGYSSLSYLTQLPLDEIKIDTAFVRNLPGSIHDETIARAIVTMGLGLNLNVIAEGVETEAQRAYLQTLGCHEYQGYLFSHPLTIEAFEKYLGQFQLREAAL